MSTHIIVVTHLEEPKVYLSQQAEFSTLMNSLRGDPMFCHRRSNVYGLVPDPNPDHHTHTLAAIRLMKVGTTDIHHVAQSHFQEALLYAQQEQPRIFQEFLRDWKTILEGLTIQQMPLEVAISENL